MAEKKERGGVLERLLPVLLFASIGLAFAVGVLWQKVSSLEKGTTPAKVAGEVAQNPDTVPDTNAPQPQEPLEGKLSEDQAAKLVKVDSDDHVRGNSNASVYLIEYSDYECPFCASFHTTANQVLDEYGDDVAWVYRHYPLDQLHPRARPAAKASECVAELGGNEAFWAFSDIIFEDQSKLSDLEAVASDVGLDSAGFKSCIDSDKYAELVENDLQEGTAAGVRGTPGNFIVNKGGDVWFVPGAFPFAQLKPYIDEALAS
jgi:protein-disulfide isomerase